MILAAVTTAFWLDLKRFVENYEKNVKIFPIKKKVESIHIFRIFTNLIL